MNFSIGDIVILKSFLGTNVAQEDIDEKENYWKLIGSKGRIIEKKEKVHPAFPEKGLQVLVQFSKDLKELNLICHNKTPNSLWIFQSDLTHL